MNDFSTLKTLRSEVPTPGPDDLAPAFARLEQAMAAEVVGSAAAGSGSRSAKPRRRSWKRRLAWIAGSSVGAVALAFGVGPAATAFTNYQTNVRLHEIAGAAIEFDDVTPGPGQYLLSTTRADWGDSCEVLEESVDGGDPVLGNCVSNIQTIDVYMPTDPVTDWVMVRDWGRDEAITAPQGSGVHVERLTAPYGNFYAGTGDPVDFELSPEESGWIGVDVRDIPTKSGEAAYNWVDSQYTGGSASREENNFVRITDILRSGLVSAPERASLIQALARIPGVTSTPDAVNLDGAKGTAFGRNEAEREGERMEIIIDPETGLVIGERTFAGDSRLGFDAGEVTSLTAITTRVVDAVPSDAVLATAVSPSS